MVPLSIVRWNCRLVATRMFSVCYVQIGGRLLDAVREGTYDCAPQRAAILSETVNKGESQRKTRRLFRDVRCHSISLHDRRPTRSWPAAAVVPILASFCGKPIKICTGISQLREKVHKRHCYIKHIDLKENSWLNTSALGL